MTTLIVGVLAFLAGAVAGLLYGRRHPEVADAVESGVSDAQAEVKKL